MKKLLMFATALVMLGGLVLAQAPKDTYVYMTFGEIDTLDPEGSYDSASWTAIENIYETLYSYKGESITEYTPTLATDFTVSDDGKTYTFNLRQGVKFHSGNDFTCRDVEYSLERDLVMNDPESGIWFIAEALLGTASNANDDDSITWAMIDNAVTCLDDFTVQFNLPAVDPAFFGKMIASNASIVDSAWAIANGEWSGTEADWKEWVGVNPRDGFLHNNASGTGAYSLVNWDGTDLVAEAFPDYWGGEPAIKTVVYQSVDEEATRILALQNGDADRIEVNNWGVVESQVRGLPGVTVHESDDWSSVAVGAIHLNQNVVTEDNAANVGCGDWGCGIPANFFSDVNVRKAFAYSFDQQQFIDELYLGKGNSLTMALPPSYLGYDPGIPIYTFDPEKAEEHFRAAFGGELWEKGFEMTISYNTGNTTRQTIAEIMKANIEDINPNFKVNVRGIQWPDFLSDRNQNKLPVSIVGWIPDYADPDNYMWTFYHSTGFYGKLLNFADPEIDQLLVDARSTTNPQERAFLYQQVGRRAYDLVPTIPYPQQRPFIVTRENLQGVYRNPMLSHEFLWKDISKQ